MIYRTLRSFIVLLLPLLHKSNKALKDWFLPQLRDVLRHSWSIKLTQKIWQGIVAFCFTCFFWAYKTTGCKYCPSEICLKFCLLFLHILTQQFLSLLSLLHPTLSSCAESVDFAFGFMLWQDDIHHIMNWCKLLGSLNGSRPSRSQTSLWTHSVI